MNDHGVILRKRQQPGIGQPELDRYSQGERKKTFGYPKGQNTMFLDGRLLRDCVFPRFEVNLAAGGGTTNDSNGILNFQGGGTIPNDRACYIVGVTSGPVWSAFFNAWAAWQLWANGSYLDGGVVGKWYHKVGKYVPPNSIIDFYSRVVNNGAPAVTVTMRLSVQFVIFNAARDIWEWGRADLRANPVNLAIVWP